MYSSSSSRLNLSSPIYQSPIRTAKRTDTLRLPISLNPSSFKNQILLSQRAFNNFQNNFSDQNQYTQKKICCPNCRYLFNLAMDQKLIDVLTKQKTTQTETGVYEYQRSRVEERINEETEQTAKELGMRAKSVLLMERLIDLQKSRVPKFRGRQQNDDNDEFDLRQERYEDERRKSSQLPYQVLKWKQIQVLLNYAKDYLKDDVPAYIKIMFEDQLLWGDNMPKTRVTPPSSITR